MHHSIDKTKDPRETLNLTRHHDNLFFFKYIPKAGLLAGWLIILRKVSVLKLVAVEVNVTNELYD